MRKRTKRKSTIIFYLLPILCVLIVFFIYKQFMESDKSNQEAQVTVNQKVVQEQTAAKDNKESFEKEQSVTHAAYETVDAKVSAVLEDMTLEEKIGQMVMVGFHGTEMSPEIKELVTKKSIGGVILFSRNMQTPKQVATLTNSLQDQAATSNHGIPLMVAVDQEGGDIVRMKDKVAPLPAQQELGKHATAEEVYNIAKLNGEELSTMGIDINFSPVLDLSSVDSRSFGDDREKIYQFGSQVIKGLNDTGTTGALKHFPGNGRSNVDPHVETSSVKANQLDLENSDIYPFKRMIEEMNKQQFFVMVTHIKYPAYDKENPASLSPVIIQDLLREKLGYEGIVVTDDMEMGAVNKYYSYEDMGIEAVKAGVDLLLVCHEYESQLEVYNGILKAVKAGDITEERINESVERILKHKFSTEKEIHVDPEKAANVVGSDKHYRLINDYKQAHDLPEAEK
ncbi:beta-N-acetylhexosaminidase [Metabacillus iocasae]|uniref:Beta-N-acetylhexosaminidase n=1 Tax=Priestia iocasae TaxID=2291674 RepID=A0ABS2QWX9_9BACI|nr:beta-N-acetylhexosaminidase [Metabacillus iocasae]MBM7703989.1 beta-N-acetylhexosaminidase [Metabacillus iocasae]